MSAEIQTPLGINIFKTQVDAVAFLKERGFKLSKSALNRDVKANKISTTPEGYFEELSLLAYANAMKAPTAKHEDKEFAKASKEKLSHDARLKKYQADRLELKLEQDRGSLISRLDHERDLAARALFFKREVENFIHLHGPGMVYLVGGDQEKLQELEKFWEEKTADWMDAWAQEREFVLSQENEEEEE